MESVLQRAQPITAYRATLWCIFSVFDVFFSFDFHSLFCDCRRITTCRCPDVSQTRLGCHIPDRHFQSAVMQQPHTILTGGTKNGNGKGPTLRAMWCPQSLMLVIKCTENYVEPVSVLTILDFSDFLVFPFLSAFAHTLPLQPISFGCQSRALFEILLYHWLNYLLISILFKE